jgi:hypothetical protein
MSRWKRALALTLGVVGVVGIIAWWGMRRYAASLPSVRRARASVKQIVFLRGRALVRNELSEVFASDDNGRSWRGLSEKPPTMTVANGNELWGAHGWPGHHEGPSASIWASADRGETWSNKDVELTTKHGPALYAQLPAAFLNEPGDPALLLMSNAQIVRPELAADSSTWKRVGHPVPDIRSSRGTVNPTVAGRRYGRSIYVASVGRIFLSNDDGLTWVHQNVHPFFDARIQCVELACYALLMELGSEWNGLMTTEAGTNDWTLISTFGLPALEQALAADPSRGVVEAFGACALVATTEAIYVAGIVNAGRNPRGVVLRVTRDGAITAVGQSVPEGLWELERAPDGSLWAGGQGAFRLEAGGWTNVWSASHEEFSAP